MIRFRDATAADVHAISALAAHVFISTYSPDGIDSQVGQEVMALCSLEESTRRMADAATRFILAEAGELLVGFAELSRGRPIPSGAGEGELELVRLYVNPGTQRQGLGRSLIQHAESAGRGMGSPTLWLTAWVENERALAFYAALQYRCVGSTQYVFGDRSYENKVLIKDLRTVA